VGAPARPESLEPVERLAAGPEHGVDQVGAGAGRGQQLGEEGALLELQAGLVGLLLGPLLGDLLPARQQAWMGIPGLEDQVLHPDLPPEVVGQLLVDRLGADRGGRCSAAQPAPPARFRRGALAGPSASAGRRSRAWCRLASSAAMSSSTPPVAGRSAGSGAGWASPLRLSISSSRRLR